MAGAQKRIKVTLDPEYAERLARLAARMCMNEGTLARSLLSRALDEADIDARRVVDLLDGIPGALETAELGRRQARDGQTVSLADL